MRKKTLCIIETLCMIVFPIIILIQVWIGWKYMYEVFRIEIKIDDNNKKIVEKFLANSEYDNLENVDRIQSINTHHDRYVLYYNDGHETVFSSDDYKELRKYIEENGRSFYIYYFIAFGCVVSIFIAVIIIKIKVTKELDRTCHIQND